MIPLPPLVASLTDYIAERCDAARVEVHWVGVDPARLPEDSALRWSGDPCRPRPELRLEVIDDGELRARFTVRPTADIWVAAPVAATALAVGDPVVPVDGMVPLRDLRGTPIRSGALVARVPLAAGDPITDAVAMLPVDAVAGAPVRLSVTHGALTVHAPGRLLADARLGEPVRVVNDATHVTLDGVLVAPGVVEVGRSR